MTKPAQFRTLMISPGHSRCEVTQAEKSPLA